MTLTEPDRPRLTINLEYGDSSHRTCTASPVDRYARFAAPDPEHPGHGRLTRNVAVLAIPDDIERDWWSRADSAYLRRRVRRAEKLGYEFRPFDFRDHRDEVHEINTSKAQRQGQTMTEAYTAYPAAKAPFRDQPCPRHRNDYVGLFQDGRLYAYALLRQCGEMVLFSEILGHGDRLDDGIMFQLVYESVRLRQAESGTAYGVYHVLDDAGAGLRYFKEQAGFAGFDVTWEIGRPGVAVPTFDVDPARPDVLRVTSTPRPTVPPGMTYPTRDEVWANRSAAKAFPADLLRGARSAISFYAAAFFGRNDVVFLDRAGIGEIALVDTDGPKLAAMAEIYPAVGELYAEDAVAVAERLRAAGQGFDVVACDPPTGAGWPLLADHFDAFAALARRVWITGVTGAELEQAGVPASVTGVQAWLDGRGHTGWEVAWLAERNPTTRLSWLALRRRH